MKIVLAVVVLCVMVASVVGQGYVNDPWQSGIQSGGSGIGTGYCPPSFCRNGKCYDNEYNRTFNCRCNCGVVNVRY
ncbi:hypothetical protein ACJMK2_032713 [Sinanodonta woodiana]|uniref:Uncharacterized protein n=1 Tax=Sinanodonta woodiana TaxID=1069815 RepID=A0ABD3X642_SINWO